MKAGGKRAEDAGRSYAGYQWFDVGGNADVEFDG